MASEKDSCCSEKRGMHGNASGGAIYGIGLIGALVYFIQHAATFWIGVLGILKAIIWPALLVYKLLEFLKL
jgi:hypothetical protein